MKYQYTTASFGTHWLSMPNQSGILGNLPLADPAHYTDTIYIIRKII